MLTELRISNFGVIEQLAVRFGSGFIVFTGETGAGKSLLIDAVTPHALGALIAFYEHRTFANGILLQINSFDQFGVELGKEIAKSIEKDGAKGFDPSTMALIEIALG